MNRYGQSRYRGFRGREGDDGRRDRERWNEDVPRQGGFYAAGGYGFNPGEYEGSDETAESQRRGNRYPDPDQSRDWQQSYGGGYGPERSGQGDYGRGYGLGRSGQRGFGRGSRAPYSEHYGLGRGGYGTSEWGKDYGNARRMNEPLERYRPGPKGYTRTDDRIREEISERLRFAYEIDSSEVSVGVKDGKVTLEGTVPERRMKHAIEDIADRCSGGQEIENNVRVSRESR